MRYILVTGLLLLLAINANPLKAQNQKGKINDYVVATSKFQQIAPILLAAKTLAMEDGEAFGEFKILVCGKAIEDLTQAEVATRHIETAEKLGVEILACEYSMKQLDIQTTSLVKGGLTVENAILENLQLQKKGYISLGL